MKKQNMLKKLVKELGITVAEFYKVAHTDQPKLSYYKRKNNERYQDTITVGIVNHFNVSHEELIHILKLYNLQRDK